jgi:DNA-binding GntR family transcriptional regulator
MSSAAATIHSWARCLDDGEPSPVWMEAHSEYHATVVAACQSPLLIRLRQQLFEAAELYRHWSSRSPIKRATRGVDREHKAILTAALARDADEAVRVTTEHLNTTARLVLDDGEAFMACGHGEQGPSASSSRRKR